MLPRIGRHIGMTSENLPELKTAILAAFLLAAIGCNKPPVGEIPPGFDIPTVKKFDNFQLKAIRESDAERDFEAVMESRVRLRAIFGEDWPKDDFTLEENRADLREHQESFIRRKSFAYSILSANGDRILGCVYLVPRKQSRATVIFWIRDSALGTHPEALIRKELEPWLKSAWPNEFEFHASLNRDDESERVMAKKRRNGDAIDD